VSPLLSLSSSSRFVAGAVIEIDLKSTGGGTDFSFMRAWAPRATSKAEVEEKPVLDLRGDGSIHSRGTGSFALGLHVASTAQLTGGFSLGRSVISAGDLINIPRNVSYVIISDDGNEDGKNILSFQAHDAFKLEATGNEYASESSEHLFREKHNIGGTNGPVEGQVLLVSNRDGSPTGGEAEIPPGSTVMFVFDGRRFVDVEALHAPIRVSFMNNFYVYH